MTTAHGCRLGLTCARQTGIPLPALPAGVLQGRERKEVLPDDILPLVPQPDSWIPTGEVVTITTLVTDNPQAAIIDALALRLNLSSMTGPRGTPLNIETDPDLAKGGYRLNIGPCQVTLIAAGPEGIHHGLITLLTLRETCSGHLPCGVLIDEPRFDWRGQHLDCARHFYSVETILKMLDLVALLKLNRFHWHFADDEAFRLELDSLPELWQKTAFRDEGELIPGVFGRGIRSGGSYSKADVGLSTTPRRCSSRSCPRSKTRPTHSPSIRR